MKKQLLVLLALVLVVGLGFLEIFYFRFHTYFQGTQVAEAPLGSTVELSADEEEVMRTIAEGSFGMVDAIHKGSGQAKMIQNAEQTYVRFEDFSVTNGPDLYVYLSDSAAPGHTLESLGNYVSLGRLKGNSGNQNYIVPPEYSGYQTVVIWCQQFGVLFSFAVLT